MNFVIIAVVATIVQAKQQKGNKSEQENSGSSVIVVFLLGAIAVALGLYYDKKHGYRYSRALRGKIGDCIMMIRRKRSYTKQLSQKVEPQDNQTARNSMYDHQKTYIEAVPDPVANPGTQQILVQQPCLPQQLPSDTPQPDFKGVFEIKQSKSKHKQNKKSKSKLKGRLLGKGSDNEQEQQEPCQLSNMTDQNQSQEKGVEGNQEFVVQQGYKIMEEEDGGEVVKE